MQLSATLGVKIKLYGRVPKIPQANRKRDVGKTRRYAVLCCAVLARELAEDSCGRDWNWFCVGTFRPSTAWQVGVYSSETALGCPDTSSIYIYIYMAKGDEIKQIKMWEPCELWDYLLCQKQATMRQKDEVSIYDMYIIFFDFMFLLCIIYF